MLKITPVELREIKFKKVMRGIDPREVKLYLNKAADEIEHLLSENKALREKLEKYEKQENAIKEAIIKAQEIYSQEIEKAKKEAENIIEQAKLEATNICGEANTKKQSLSKELEYLMAQKKNFIDEFKKLLTLYLDTIEKIEKGEKFEFNENK